MKVIINADGGNKIGLGHIFRCSNIAHYIKSIYNNIDIYFITNSPPAITDTILKDFVCLNSINNEYDIKGLIENSHLFLSDILDTSNLYVSRIRKFNPQIKIICIDNNTHFKKINAADVVINANVFSKSSKTNIDGTTYYLGPKYMILRNEFLKLRNNRKSKNLKRLFISFGGIDEQGITLKAIKSVLNLELDLKIDIVIGPLFNFQEELNKLINNNKKFKIYENPENIIEIMSSANLAIISAGITLYEICSLGIPSIVIPLVAHQSDIAKTFSENGACVNIGKDTDYKEISSSLNKLIKDKNQRDSLSTNARNFVDGKGLNRFIEIFEGVINEK